jgi:hypothetical protein
VNLRRITVLTLCVATLPCSHALAQGNLLYFFSDQIGRQKTRVSYSAGHFCQQGVEDQETSMSFQDHQMQISVPLWQCKTREFGLFGNFDVMDIDTRATFPRSGAEVPEHLWDVSLGAGYRQKLDNGHIIGGTLSIGSASDKPFASIEEVTATANLVYRIPAGQNDAWLLFLNWSNDRDFLPYLPLPGGGYLWQPNKQLTVLAGVPFSMVRWRPLEKLQLSARYAVLRNVHAKISYDLTEQVSVYGGFDWSPRVFFRHDREDDDHRLHFYEHKVSTGVRWNISQHVYLDVSGGYAFNRFMFEDDDWDDRDENRIDIGDGPFAMIQLGLRF